jgi:hypothetical protein
MEGMKNTTKESKEILAKTDSKGRTVRVTMEIDGYGTPTISATCDGGQCKAGYMRCPQPIAANGKQIHSLIGQAPSYGFTAAETAQIERYIESARRDQQRAADQVAAQPVNAERSQVDEMFERANRRRDYPGEYFGLLGDAKAALAAWRAKYPKAAAAEDDRDKVAAEERATQRKRDYESSFIARGLD